MMKNFSLIVLICLNVNAMQKDQVIGTVLLTGSYYCALEAYMQKYESLSEADRQTRRCCYLAGAVLLQSSGLAMLSRTLCTTGNPILTAGKFSVGAMSMAQGLYFLKIAKLSYDHYKRFGSQWHEQQMHNFICAGLLCSAFGSGLATCAINDLK